MRQEEPIDSFEQALTDPRRLEALRTTLRLDLEADEELDRVARLVRRVLRVDAAAVTLLDERTQWVKAMAAATPVPPFTTPAGESGCQHVIREAGRPVIVRDTSTAAGRWRELPAVRQGQLGAYLGAPLVTHDGHVLGALCAVETQPRPWTRDEVDVIVELAAIAMRIIESRTAVLQTEASEARYRAVTENIPGGIVLMVDHDLRYTLASGAAALADVGLTTSDIVGRTLREVVAPENREVQERAYRQALEGIEGETRSERNGRTYRLHTVPVRDARGRVTHAMGLAIDVTALVAAEAEARSLSLRDELTGLYNRRGFLEVSRPLLAQAARSGREALVFFVDLNDMKGINDRHGHDAGDVALRATADLLRMTFRASDVVARLGGDEFAVFAPDMIAETSPALQARTLANVQAFNQSGEVPWRLSVSMGAASYDPRVARTVEALLEEADAKMYDSKRRRYETRGRSGVAPFGVRSRDGVIS